MNVTLKDKKVIMRVDFNVPLDGDQKITDDTRIRAAIPSIKHILDEGAALILMSHLGRPQKKKLDNGEINVKKFTLSNIVEHLSAKIGRAVKFCPELVGEKATAMAEELQVGEVLLLENTRFGLRPRVTTLG